MQRAHGRGSFTGYARKLSADVDAGTPMSGLRQYRGLIDSLSPRGSAHSQSHAARGAVGERSTVRSNLAGGGVVGLSAVVSAGPSVKLKPATDQGLPVI